MIDRSAETALIELVREVAKAEILPRFRRLDATEIDTKSGPEDLVTAADLAAEAKLVEGIARIMPDAEVVGEEGVAADPSRLDLLSGSGCVVVVDPVDGTWNFARGLAVFGVILAVVEDGRTVFGLLYDPVFDDWFAARRGGGAWTGGAGRVDRPLTIDGTMPVSEASGYVPVNLYPEELRMAVSQATFRTGGARSLRCSCHEYRLLASGAVDYLISGLLKPWDHLAGALITREAGGFAAMMGGQPYRPFTTEGQLVAASSYPLWSGVSELFETALQSQMPASSTSS
ncbi:inositol monophosphatase family protein [Pelagovum pacificum]|uniref:Inositol monophosphatase n=1 Tax=Pelagovum pacificum TaxID=2588711 RepID=A0A5C5GE67_9RHOB|nr:inositol monophosphatase [Pelagovum pacificum]QQA44379.1 inositol monophosphatase [Pelagovum pacificum]TNY32504.1 inositol monophosphatase [Pelagovum pacificum]